MPTAEKHSQQEALRLVACGAQAGKRVVSCLQLRRQQHSAHRHSMAEPRLAAAAQSMQQTSPAAGRLTGRRRLYRNLPLQKRLRKQDLQVATRPLWRKLPATAMTAPGATKQAMQQLAASRQAAGCHKAMAGTQHRLLKTLI